MDGVSIINVSTAQPRYWVASEEVAARIAAATGERRRVSAIVRGSQISRRATAVSADEIGCLGTIGERNAIYKREAPPLALAVTRAALAAQPQLPPGLLITSSCTGYMVPGWDVTIAQDLALPTDLVRLPLTQTGCAGGVLALARAADYVQAHPGRSALAVAVELCSLAFHPASDSGNLVSALLFGDGAGAALLQRSEREGLSVVSSLSILLPQSSDALGFDLTDNGFYPVLGLDLANRLPAAVAPAAARLCAEQGIQRGDLSFLLLHPGGPAILDNLEAAFGMSAARARWSHESLRELGNTSSAAIFDVIRRYLDDADAPRGWGLVAAFGPGVSIEMLIVHRC